jgi:N-glycosylase/DNA lyase
MNIYEEGNNVVVKKLDDFDLAQTLECGQCFRFFKLEDYRYIVIAKNRFLEIEQINHKLIFYNTTMNTFNHIWKKYFDLDRDYNIIKKHLIKDDLIMETIIKSGSGIRILGQDFLEVLISFIISQNKQIPQIKQVIDILCRKHGAFIQRHNGIDYYSFPTIEKLKTLSEENFKECKAGFRGKYLVDACEKLSTGAIKEEELLKLSSLEILDELCSIKGVGVKVSNCVLLFGLRHKEAFPVDVWIKRIMENLYFKEETKLEVIQKFAEEKFGKYGGYAQQYLFYYARNI